MNVQWPLLIFGLLAGLSMGCLGVVSVAELRDKLGELRLPGLAVALGALAAGGVASALHMGNPGRVLYVLGNLGSGIAQELLATAVAGIVIVAYLVAIAKQASPGVRKVLAVLGLITAVVLPFITGHAYVQGARPAWDTWFLPLMYVGAAGAMGLLTMYLLGAIKKVDAADLVRLGKATFVAVIVFAVTAGLYLAAVAFAPYPTFSRSIARVFAGDLAPLFWGGVVVAGVAVPLALTGMGSFGRALGASARGEATAGVGVLATKPAVIAIGLICLLIGSVAVRMIMYMLGTSVQSFIY